MRKFIFVVVSLAIANELLADTFDFKTFLTAYYSDMEKDTFDYIMTKKLNLHPSEGVVDSLFYTGNCDEGMIIVNAMLDGWKIKRLTLTIGQTITGRSQITTINDRINIGLAFVTAEIYIKSFSGEPIFSILDLMKQIEDENADYIKIFVNLIPEIIESGKCYAEWLDTQTKSFARIQLEPYLTIMFAR